MKSLRLMICTVLTLTIVSCASTRIVTKWRDPSISARPIVFSKVLAMVISNDQALRHVAEDALCDQVKRVQCKPGYMVIPDSKLTDIEAVRDIVRQEGFDAVIVFRVLGTRESVTYIPPAPGPGFWGYYGAFTFMYDPGYYVTDEFVRVETSIYSIPDNKLLWVATTDTINPDSVRDLVKDVAEAVRKELEREAAMPSS